MLAEWGLEEFSESSKEVRGLWADLPAEAGNLSFAHLGNEDSSDFVHRLDSHCHTLRQRVPLIARELQVSAMNPHPLQIENLHIKAVHHSPKALLVDLGPLWLKVRGFVLL